MKNTSSDPNFHPIYTLAKTAIEQRSSDGCLADGAARAAADELLAHWGCAIRNWGGCGPGAAEVEKMIVGDLRDVAAALMEVADEILCNQAK
jgi:hypothetical protein